MHLYLADVTSLLEEETYREALTKVSPERWEKAERIRIPSGRALSLGAALLLKEALIREGIEEGPEMVTGEKGKPYLKDHPEIYFNLSHAGTRVMCVVAPCEAGCDVEKISDAHQEIADRFFTAEEAEVIRSAAKEEKAVLFSEIWTAKESFLKATGIGIGLGLDKFSVMDPQGHAKLRAVKEMPFRIEDYVIRRFDLQDGYRYAVCLKTEGDPKLSRLLEETEPEWIDL